MANTIGEKELKTNWPVEDGITASTTTQKGHKMQLEPTGLLGKKSNVREIERLGF